VQLNFASSLIRDTTLFKLTGSTRMGKK